MAAHSSLGPLERLRALWPLLVPGHLGQRSRPLRLDGKRLVVAVESNVLAQELQLESSRILRALRDKADDIALPVPESITWRVAPDALPPSLSRPQQPAGMTPVPAAPRSQLPETLAESLGDVDDLELRQQLERLSHLRNGLER